MLLGESRCRFTECCPGSPVWLLAGLLMMALADPSSAQTLAGQLPSLGHTQAASTGLLQTTLGLLTVLGAILALAWVVRRFGRLPVAGKGLVTVLGGTTLGSRERLVVVQVEATRLVLGVAPGRIQTLYVLDENRRPEAEFPKVLETELPGAE